MILEKIVVIMRIPESFGVLLFSILQYIKNKSFKLYL